MKRTRSHESEQYSSGDKKKLIKRDENVDSFSKDEEDIVLKIKDRRSPSTFSNNSSSTFENESPDDNDSNYNQKTRSKSSSKKRKSSKKKKKRPIPQKMNILDAISHAYNNCVKFLSSTTTTKPLTNAPQMLEYLAEMMEFVAEESTSDSENQPLWNVNLIRHLETSPKIQYLNEPNKKFCEVCGTKGTCPLKIEGPSYNYDLLWENGVLKKLDPKDDEAGSNGGSGSVGTASWYSYICRRCKSFAFILHEFAHYKFNVLRQSGTHSDIENFFKKSTSSSNKSSSSTTLIPLSTSADASISSITNGGGDNPVSTITTSRKSRLEKFFGRTNHLRLKTDVESDGNCQFRAVADQLGCSINSEYHLVIRKRAVQWLRQNRNLKICGAKLSQLLDTESVGHHHNQDNDGALLTWDEFCDRMSMEGEWGNYITLIAIANEFHVRIHVFQDTDIMEKFIEIPRVQSITTSISSSSWQQQQKQGKQTKQRRKQQLLNEEEEEEEEDDDDAVEIEQPQLSSEKILYLCLIQNCHYISITKKEE